MRPRRYCPSDALEVFAPAALAGVDDIAGWVFERLAYVGGSWGVGRAAVKRVVAALVLLTLAAPAASARRGVPPELASLERRPVLDQIGIPAWAGRSLVPVASIGFERPNETRSYATPQTATTRHERSGRLVHTGAWAQDAWLTGVVPTTPEPDGPNHRGYPIVRLSALGAQPCATPCLVDVWVWLDVHVRKGEWFSLATFALEPSDRWSRVVGVNVDERGRLYVFHVPDHGRGDWLFQSDARFPMRRWVRVTTYLDARPGHGAMAAWFDGKLASVARLNGGTGTLPQAHFGLYSSPGVLAARVVNDDIRFWRVS